MSDMKALSDKQEAIFMTIAETVTPEVADLDGDGRARMTAIVDTALMDRNATMRKQFGTFLGVIRVAPLLRYGRTFGGLDPVRRHAVLAWLQDCPVGLLRQGFWGLKALVFMGYYGQPEHWGEIGYAPSFDGREGVHRA
jgi:hypothetical protein